MRPVIDALRRRGDEVQVTARDFAQTLGLLERFQIDHTAIGHHRGGHVAAKGARARVALGRARALGERAPHRPRARPRLQRRLGRRQAAADPVGDRVRLRVGARSSTRSTAGSRARVVVPDVIPPERLAPYGATPEKLRPLRGAQGGVLPGGLRARPGGAATSSASTASAAARRRAHAARRLALPPLRGAGVHPGAATACKGEQVVVLPRTDEQRAELAREGGFIVPEQAIDAQSLIAFADLVISAGGTMNREAVALGTPVWTTFEGRLGAVDERLIADGRLRRLTRADDVVLERRDAGAAPPQRIRRDPEVFTDLFVKAVRPRVFAPHGPIHCPGCAAGSAPRPFRSIATPFRRWRWTRGWSRWLITWPTGSGSTAASRPSTRPVQAHDRVRDRRLAGLLRRSSACTGTGCGTRRSASTSRSPRASCSPCSRWSATSRSSSRS